MPLNVRLYEPVAVKGGFGRLRKTRFPFLRISCRERALRCCPCHVRGSDQLIPGSSDPACHNAECMDHRPRRDGATLSQAETPP